MHRAENFRKTVGRGTRRRLLIAVGGLAVIAVVYLGVYYLVLSSSLSAQRVHYELTPADSGLSTEEVQFESDVDRIPLVGWLLGSSRDRAIVLGHVGNEQRVHGRILG